MVALLACGLVELVGGRGPGSLDGQAADRCAAARHSGCSLLGDCRSAAAVGGIGALVWVAFKVGALSFGGGFVIIPLMQHDAVTTYHWMSSAQFLNAVALGQVTPGPVVATVAAVGYAAHGRGRRRARGSGRVHALIRRRDDRRRRAFEQIRGSARAQAFLDGAGPAAIGAILGSAMPLAGGAAPRLADPGAGCGGRCALLLARRGVVETLLAAGAIGTIVVLAGAPA